MIFVSDEAVDDDFPFIAISENGTDRRFGVLVTNDTETKNLHAKSNSRIIAALRAYHERTSNIVKMICPKMRTLFSHYTAMESTRIKNGIANATIRLQNPRIIDDRLDILKSKASSSFVDCIRNDFSVEFEDVLREVEDRIRSLPTLAMLTTHVILIFAFFIAVNVGLNHIFPEGPALVYRLGLCCGLLCVLTGYSLIKILPPYREKHRTISMAIQSAERQAQIQMCAAISSCLDSHYRELAANVDKWRNATTAIYRKIKSYDSGAISVKKSSNSVRSICYLPIPSREEEYFNYFFNQYLTHIEEEHVGNGTGLL